MFHSAHPTAIDDFRFCHLLCRLLSRSLNLTRPQLTGIVTPSELQRSVSLPTPFVSIDSSEIRFDRLISSTDTLRLAQHPMERSGCHMRTSYLPQLQPQLQPQSQPQLQPQSQPQSKMQSLTSILSSQLYCVAVEWNRFGKFDSCYLHNNLRPELS